MRPFPFYRKGIGSRGSILDFLDKRYVIITASCRAVRDIPETGFCLRSRDAFRIWWIPGTVCRAPVRISGSGIRNGIRESCGDLSPFSGFRNISLLQDSRPGVLLLNISWVVSLVGLCPSTECTDSVIIDRVCLHNLQIASRRRAEPDRLTDGQVPGRLSLTPLRGSGSGSAVDAGKGSCNGSSAGKGSVPSIHRTGAS